MNEIFADYTSEIINKKILQATKGAYTLEANG